jgi:hypothetical protein
MAEQTKLKNSFVNRSRNHTFIVGDERLKWLALQAINMLQEQGNHPADHGLCFKQIIMQAGFKPVFADVDPLSSPLLLSFESKITAETRCTCGSSLVILPRWIRSVKLLINIGYLSEDKLIYWCLMPGNVWVNGDIFLFSFGEKNHQRERAAPFVDDRQLRIP